jgi:hypothetical protein
MAPTPLVPGEDEFSSLEESGSNSHLPGFGVAVVSRYQHLTLQQDDRSVQSSRKDRQKALLDRHGGVVFTESKSGSIVSLCPGSRHSRTGNLTFPLEKQPDSNKPI